MSLLRQQSENLSWRLKNWPENAFRENFRFFQNSWIFGDPGKFSSSNLNSWRDFMLRGASRSPGLQISFKINFFTYALFFAFICRPCEPQSSSARRPQNLKPRWADSFFIVVSMSEFGVLIDLLYFTHNAKHHQNSQKMALQGAVDALEANLPTSCLAPPYYSISSISKGYKLYESLK